MNFKKCERCSRILQRHIADAMLRLERVLGDSKLPDSDFRGEQHFAQVGIEQNHSAVHTIIRAFSSQDC